MNAWNAGLLNGLTPPPTKSPITVFCPGFSIIVMDSGSKNAGAAVDERTTCHRGYSPFPITPPGRDAEYVPCGLLDMGHGLPLSNRFDMTSRPVCSSGP